MKFWYFRRTLFFSQRNKIIFGGKKHTALFQFWYFRRTLFLSQRNEIIFGGKKHTALFQTHNWEVFQHARTCIRTVIRKYVTGGK